MGFWNKLGKVALQAAPYVAAPFTGGASLYAVPATQKLGQKWSEHDANENAKKGLAPSSFDNILNKTSGYVGMASSLGAPGISGGKNAPPTTFGKNSGVIDESGAFGRMGSPRQQVEADNSRIAGGGRGTDWGGIAGSIMDIMNRRGAGQGQEPSLSNSNGLPAGVMNFNGAGQSQGGQTGRYDGYMRGLGPVMGRRDQNFPNLAESIGAGRQDAIRNQPFRQGYDVLTPGPEPADDSMGNIGPQIRTRMPPIYPTGSSNRRRYAS